MIYGIDLFFDAAVGGKNRSSFQDESDLDGLKDSVLLDTSLKLELISEVVFLDDQVVHFSKNLTCIIGGRGAGKSTMLESLCVTSGNGSANMSAIG